jgi:hypothetical protein
MGPDTLQRLTTRLSSAAGKRLSSLTTSSFANVVLTGGGSIALLVLSHYLYRDWTARGQFPAAPHSSPWTAGRIWLAALATLLFASLRLQSTFKTAMAVLCLSVTAILYTAELVLAASNSGLGTPSTPWWSIDRASAARREEIAAFARKSEVTVDTRDRVELLADLRGRGIDAVPAVMLGVMLGEDVGPQSSDAIEAAELQPLGGIANSLTVLCNESGQYVTYTSDQHGFRNPARIWGSARADMAAVGESFVQGYCVPDGKGFVDVLRTRYPATLNLGISGQSSLMQLAAIKEYLPRLAPRIVLWVFCEGIDLDDLRDEATHPLLMRYLEPAFSQQLVTRQPDIDDALRRFVSSTETRARETESTARRPRYVDRSLGIAKLWNLREKIDLVYGIQFDAAQQATTSDEATYDIFRRALAQAQSVTSSWDGTLYFVYLPSWNRYRNGPRVPEREHTKVLSIVKALQIPVIDVEPAFEATNDPLSLFPFRRFGHYNETGNKIAADTVGAFLSTHERNPVPDRATGQH